MQNKQKQTTTLEKKNVCYSFTYIQEIWSNEIVNIYTQNSLNAFKYRR